MYKRYHHGLPLLFAILVLFFADVVTTAVFAADVRTTAIQSLQTTPQQHLDKKVAVEGRLKLIGDYWKVHEFVVVDEQGNQVPVMPWAPYEVMKSPIEEIQRKAPKTMGYYIGKNVSVTGTFKSREKYGKLEYYIDTESANEIAK